MRLNRISAKMAMTMLLLSLALPAAASDFTLGVFGNANEDDTINMQDVTYIEWIINDYRDRTELADAKYDGKINMQDVTQTELIILGKGKEITVKDAIDRNVTINQPNGLSHSFQPLPRWSMPLIWAAWSVWMASHTQIIGLSL